MIELKKINIGDLVYTHDKIDNSLNKMVIKEIKHNNNYYFIHGVNENGVSIRASSLDNAFYTKEEAINSYLTKINKEIIKVITSI